MAIVLKPVAQSKRQFAYRLKPPPKKSELLSQRTEEGSVLDYIDLLSAFLYADEHGSGDIRVFIRNILFALSQKYTNEEIKEIIISGDGKLGDERFAKREDSNADVKRYSKLIRSFLDSGSVYSSLIGETALFEKKEEFDTLFSSIENEAEGQSGIGRSRIDIHEDSNPNVPTVETKSDEDKEPSKAKTKTRQHPKSKMDSLVKQLESITASPIAQAFINSLLQAGEAGLATREDVGEYVATMLHGIGIVVPYIEPEEVEEMIAYIRRYIDERADRIIAKQIEHFERED